APVEQTLEVAQQRHGERYTLGWSLRGVDLEQDHLDTGLRLAQDAQLFQESTFVVRERRLRLVHNALALLEGDLECDVRPRRHRLRLRERSTTPGRSSHPCR